MTEIVATTLIASVIVPTLLADEGKKASNRYAEFFTVRIRNIGTRDAYSRAAREFFHWCHECNVTLEQVSPMVVATYIELLTKHRSAPTVKLHLAALRMLFDWLATGNIVEFNPAAAVRGPKHIVKKGKTSVLSAEEARQLIDSIDETTIKGSRDRALIGVLVFTFARISAALGMDVEHYYSQSHRKWIRLKEKNSKIHDVPVHHTAIDYLEAYLEMAKIRARPGTPLFRTIGPKGELTENRMHRSDALRMIKRQAKKAKIETQIGCHTWRATGITNFIANGGSLENAAKIAAHESSRTTMLYDRTSDAISLDEIERVRI